MNILHISPYYPSIKAFHAGGVAMGKEIETLKKLGHKVYSLSFVQKKYDFNIFKQEKDDMTDCIIIDNRRKLYNILSHLSFPVFFGTRCDKIFQKKIENFIETYNIDAIHAEYAAMLYYADIKKKYPNIKFNIVLHDVTIQSFERKYTSERNVFKKICLRFEKRRIERFEKKYLEKCDQIITFSDKDKVLVKKYYGLESNVINTYFRLERIEKMREVYKREKSDEFALFFLGQMGRIENHEAALRLIRIFKELCIENKHLYIVGANPSIELMRYQCDNITVTGFIEDVEQFVLKKCDMACFPLNIGAGVKIKVLEALTLGFPVVTNVIGAEGIDENEKYIFLADDDKSFIDMIYNVYKSSYTANFCEMDKEFSWKKSEKVLREIY